MTRRLLGVGIVGLQAGRGWAAEAHVPALRALPDDFEIVGVANSTHPSARQAAAQFGIPRAFANVAELIEAPDVDIVAITVRVPYHLEIAKAAIEGGKQVYCEWPLGRTLAEAEELTALAHRHEVAGVVGTQAPLAPEIEYLKQLLSEGFVGDVLSTSVIGRGGPLQGSGAIPDRKNYGYLLDRSNGASLLTIPVGHMLAALTSVLGEVTQVSALLATRRATALVLDTGETLPVSAPDEVLVAATLASGAPASIHYRGGASRDECGLLWEIHGSEGTIRVTGPSGHAQMVPLSLTGSRGEEKGFRRLDVPSPYRLVWPRDPKAGNVARVYSRMAHDLLHGTRTAPSFADGLELHRTIAAIEAAAETGTRASISRPNPGS